MEIIENKALVLKLRDPHRVTSVIPKSKLLDDGRVIVSWGLDEAQVLKNLKIKDVPSPIYRDYDWPGMFTPFEHQKITSSFLTLHKRAFCFNEQGVGKTGSVIWAADYLMRKGRIRRVLIICPLSIMDSAWREDLFKIAMHRSVDIAYGTAEKRQLVIDGPAEFVIINYDGVEVVLDAIQNNDFDLIVVDEANAYKNSQTVRWKTLNKLVKPDTWLWMLTGTPAAHSPADAYGLAKLINPTAVPRYFTSFKDQVMYKLTNFKWVARPTAKATVHNALQPAIRFTKDECLDLPEMIYVNREVQLTKQQIKYYEQMRKHMVLQLAGEEITAVNAAINLSKLLQISGGSTYTDSKEVIKFDVSNRYKVLKEIIDEASHKVLIFVPFKHAISIVSKMLTDDGITNAIIQGDVSAAKRTEIFKTFQDPESDLRVLVIQPQAAAHGVTLTAADTTIWWGPTGSPETYQQANARMHRAGQRHPCTVFRLYGSVAEKYVYKELLDKKIDIQTGIMDLYKALLA